MDTTQFPEEDKAIIERFKWTNQDDLYKKHNELLHWREQILAKLDAIDKMIKNSVQNLAMCAYRDDLLDSTKEAEESRKQLAQMQPRIVDYKSQILENCLN